MDDTQRQCLWTYGPKQTDLMLLWINQADKALPNSDIKVSAIIHFKDILWKMLNGPSSDKNQAPKIAWGDMMNNYYVKQPRLDNPKKMCKSINTPDFS